MGFRVYVDGQEGTTGLRIHEMLAGRSDLEVLKIDPDLRKDAAERTRLLRAADVAFLCLPDAASREAAAWCEGASTRLIDASTAFRTDPGWVYGLPELAMGQRGRIRASRRIANPGCHATAFLLLVRPLVDAGLLPAGAPLHALSVTGYSGGGRRMIEQYEQGQDPLLMAPRQYGMGLTHKHLPEMRMHGRLEQAPVFSPIVGPFLKGMAVSIGLSGGMLRTGTTLADIHDVWQAHYQGARFVRVMPTNDPELMQAGFFDPQGCNDTNRADLFVCGHDDGRGDSEGQFMLTARIDNLGKGASGAAVQSMNLLMGLDEATGLA